MNSRQYWMEQPTKALRPKPVRPVVKKPSLDEVVEALAVEEFRNPEMTGRGGDRGRGLEIKHKSVGSPGLSRYDAQLTPVKKDGLLKQIWDYELPFVSDVTDSPYNPANFITEKTQQAVGGLKDLRFPSGPKIPMTGPTIGGFPGTGMPRINLSTTANVGDMPNLAKDMFILATTEDFGDTKEGRKDTPVPVNRALAGVFGAGKYFNRGRKAADEGVDVVKQADELKSPGTARTKIPQERIDAIEEALQADLPLSEYYKNLADVSGYTDNIAVNQPERYSVVFDEKMGMDRMYHQPFKPDKEAFHGFLDFKVATSRMDEIHDVFREIKDYAQRTIMGEPTDLESFLPNTKWTGGKPVERSVLTSPTPKTARTDLTEEGFDNFHYNDYRAKFATGDPDNLGPMEKVVKDFSERDPELWRSFVRDVAEMDPDDPFVITDFVENYMNTVTSGTHGITGVSILPSHNFIDIYRRTAAELPELFRVDPETLHIIYSPDPNWVRSIDAGLPAQKGYFRPPTS